MQITSKKIIAGVSCLSLAALAWYVLRPAQRELVTSARAVAIDTVRNIVTATGSLAPVDKVAVGTQVSGEVKKLYADFNSHVRKGQLLAELDKSTLLERLNQANAQLQSASSSLTLARQNYSRTKQLFEQNAATRTELEDVQNALTQAQSSLTQAQTNVREAKVNLGYAQIFCPIDGVVLDKQVEQGQTVAASFNTPTLFTIARDLKNMQVEANIDEADIGQVRVGQPVDFSVDSYNGRTFHGSVRQIRLSPVTTNNVVTYTVIISAPNPDEVLFPGMTANISIVTQEQVGPTVPASATTFVPSADVLEQLGGAGPAPDGQNGVSSVSVSGSEKTVWVKQGASISSRRIQVGLGDGVSFIVASGLSLGDSVVTSASLGKRVSSGGSGSNPLMPPRPDHGPKNSGDGAAGAKPQK